jgi:hypothetical protein
MLRFVLLSISVLCLADRTAQAESAFRVLPYLQHPTQDSITICWFSNANEPARVVVDKPGGKWETTSVPQAATALSYNPFVPEPGGPHPAIPFKHRVRVTGLKAGTAFHYTVFQGNEEHADVLQTAPGSNSPVRFILYSDSETEPESTNSSVDWPPSRGSNRPVEITKYVVDQTTGYRENLKVIDARKPNFISVVGDLAEAGGEQRDWDEFWKHNAGVFGSVASRIPILPALGNHENFAGPGGGYATPAANFATDKFLTYFEVPTNNATNPKHRGRYYRLDYGPMTLIVLDSSDGLPDKTKADTNFNLEGTNAPDFNPNSEQYLWFVKQLESAQKSSQFTFVQFHHTMYGSGPHSVPLGHPNFSGQSGIPMRVIQPLLFQYGVDAVFSGHDEMLERSMKSGIEVLPDGSKRPHTIHFYDVGIGGDGLRGPSVGFDNAYRKFLAHENSPELWNGPQLISGGKHYGHLEVNLTLNAAGKWQAVLTPVHVFPLMNADGHVAGWERRVYDDTVTLTAESSPQLSALPVANPDDGQGVLAACLLLGLSGTACLLRYGHRQVSIPQVATPSGAL